jgi:uncharacterized protein with NRDE domain
VLFKVCVSLTLHCLLLLLLQPGVQYGTRSQTIIAVWRDGRVEQRERYIEKEEGHGTDGKHQWVWKEAKHSFHLTAQLQQQQQQQDAGGFMA